MLFTIPNIKIQTIKNKVDKFYKIDVDYNDIVFIIAYMHAIKVNSEEDWTEIRITPLNELSVHFLEIITIIVSRGFLVLRDFDNEIKFKFMYTEKCASHYKKINIPVKNDRRTKRIRQFTL